MYALILAGGRGQRLRPLTDTVAKPMIPINGKPIMWYQFSLLKEVGVTEIVILCSYKRESIQDYFGDGTGFGVRVHYSVEEKPLGRGGALKQGLSMVPGSERTIFALNGDVITAQKFDPLLKLHKKSGAQATMMLVPYPSAYGVVETDPSGRVMTFMEKGDLPVWINGGVYILDTSIRNDLPDMGDHETTTFPRLAKAGRLYAFQSRALWRSIDNHKDLLEVEETLRQEPTMPSGSR